MYPPLLKETASTRHNQMFKGSTEARGSTTRNKDSHQCPICKGYGHRWYNYKNGDPKDIAATQATNEVSILICFLSIALFTNFQLNM
jgi:hypothetical protein